MKADDYFSAPLTPSFPKSLTINALHTQNIKDTEGLVQFIIASPRPLELSEIEKISQLKDIQIGLISIMANHLAALQKADSEAYYRSEHWLDALNHLPLLGNSKIETQKLHKQTFDFSVAQAFLQLLLGAAISTTSPALAEFIHFLRKQGQKIEVGLKKSLDSYQTITISGVTEIVNHNDHLIFIPKLKILTLRFSHQSARMLLANCIGHKFTVSLEYTTMTSIFDFGALDDPTINQQFYDFLNKYRQLSIAKSDAFFSGDFYLM